jgi:hypothetical protein
MGIVEPTVVVTGIPLNNVNDEVVGNVKSTVGAYANESVDVADNVDVLVVIVTDTVLVFTPTVVGVPYT